MLVPTTIDLVSPAWDLMTVEEKQLIAKAVSGDESALQLLLVQKASALSRFALGKMTPGLREQMDPEDIVQLTFVEAFRSIDRFETDEASGFDAWLRGIANNVIRDSIKRQQRVKRGGRFQRVSTPGKKFDADSYADIVELLSDGGNTPSFSVMGHEAVAAVQDAINTLPENYRQAVQLRMLDGKSLEETAEIMECGPRAVQGLVDRAKKRIRTTLERLSRYR